MNHSIVFIHLGPKIPEFIRHSIEQARLFNSCPIYLLARQSALADFPVAADLSIRIIQCESLQPTSRHREFQSISRLDRTFREGFWTSTTERFFCLESAMAQLSLDHVFHLENDTMLYADLEKMLPVFQRHYPNLASTLDNDQRCVPGFVYAANSVALGRLNDFINRILAQPATEKLNDMVLLGAFNHHFGEEKFGHLPIVPRDYPRPLASAAGHVPLNPQLFSNWIDEFDSIFDAAAIGQYLGGIDPIHCRGADTTGFINESCVFDPSVFKYSWIADDRGRRIPYLQSAHHRFRINNLHIHSKNLAPFSSVPPISG